VLLPATLLVLLAALAAVAIAAWPGGPRVNPRSHLRPAARVAAETHPPPAARSPRPHAGSAGSAAALASRQNRAINAVLRYTSYIARGTGRRPDVALTFDDGPSPYTPSILRILIRMHVPATFFVVGQQLNDFASGVRSELRHGFDVSDHTENHAWLIRLSPSGQYGQIDDAAKRLQNLGDPFPRLLRPPYGAFNSTTVKTLARVKMLMVLWSVDPGDWRRPGVGAIESNVLKNARSGSIVLLHDGGGYRDQTVKALPAIIDGLRRRHYRLVTVPQMLIDDPPPRHQGLPHLGAG
jgi:peptidoglycan/xylan/chitin deacetylase (PgdA/CDA1 family)